MTLAQATQPVFADPYGWIDKAAGLILALTGLVTAIAAIWRGSRTAGHVSTLGQQMQQVQQGLQTVALNTPAPGNGPGQPAPAGPAKWDKPKGEPWVPLSAVTETPGPTFPAGLVGDPLDPRP